MEEPQKFMEQSFNWQNENSCDSKQDARDEGTLEFDSLPVISMENVNLKLDRSPLQLYHKSKHIRFMTQVDSSLNDDIGGLLTPNYAQMRENAMRVEGFLHRNLKRKTNNDQNGLKPTSMRTIDPWEQRDHMPTLNHTSAKNSIQVIENSHSNGL